MLGCVCVRACSCESDNYDDEWNRLDKKTEVHSAYQVVFTLFSFPEIKFLRGSLGRLRDKLCFPKTKHLVDVRQPPSGEARSADRNFEDS